MTNIDTINQISDQLCLHVISHSRDFAWKFLALKISLTRLKLKIDMYHGSDAVKKECCEELRGLLKKSINIPNAREDVQQMLDFNNANVEIA